MHRKDDKVFWLVLLIIVFISGTSSGFFGPNLVQFVLFKHGDTFLILTAFLANILTFVATGFFTLFCIGMLSYNKKLNYLGILFLVVSITTGYLSNLGYYTLVSDEGIVISNITKQTYSWTDITEAAYIDKNNEPLRKIHLTFNDGKEETLEINKVLVQEIGRIQQKFLKNDINFK
ncbi:hypothetical protein IM538_13070 [Cytobacillus suaedae]|nr:hypothetical protein IM538_13070 [Cytobacillus suaedae]